MKIKVQREITTGTLLQEVLSEHNLSVSAPGSDGDRRPASGIDLENAADEFFARMRALASNEGNK